MYLLQARTTEAQSVQAVFGPLDLQQQKENLVVDLLALGADDNVDRPGNLWRAEGAESSLKKCNLPLMMGKHFSLASALLPCN